MEAGYDIRTVQELQGNKDFWKTLVYTQVLNSGGRGAQSPADFRTALQDNAPRVIAQGV